MTTSPRVRILRRPSPGLEKETICLRRGAWSGDTCQICGCKTTASKPVAGPVRAGNKVVSQFAAGAIIASYGFFMCTVALGAALGGVLIFPGVCAVLGVPFLAAGIVLMMRDRASSRQAAERCVHVSTNA